MRHNLTARCVVEIPARADRVHPVNRAIAARSTARNSAGIHGENGYHLRMATPDPTGARQEARRSSVPDDGGGAVLRADGSYLSGALGRPQQYACLMPASAGPAEQRFPLVVLLHGLAGAWTDWPRFTRIARYLAGKNIVVVCPDGGSGWYPNGVGGGGRYEDDILQDLLPAIEKALPVLPYPHRAVGGLSMGGYGAVKIALKHPRLFHVAFSHSGALDVARRPDVHPVFGDPVGDAAFRRAEDPAWLAEQALCAPPVDRPLLFLDCGLDDPLIDANRSFSSHLDYIGYGHTYRELPGHHTWPYWDRAFRTQLAEVTGAISRAPRVR